jgi:23S rRNA (uracil1939-C5)-methyltransferase
MTEFSTLLKCEYFPLCSGCESQGDVTSPPIWQNVKEFFHRCAPAVPISLKMNEITRWRTRSKLAVRGTFRDPKIGLFKHHSHSVVPIPTCPLHHPLINAMNSKVRKAMIDCKIDPYDENKRNGILRYLQFTLERKTRLVQLALIVNCLTKNPLIEEFVKQLYKEGGFHSIWLNFQPQQTNRIFGEHWILCEGEPYLWEHLGTAKCAFHPACFIQAHLSLFEQVLTRVRDWSDLNAKVIELYAGIGVIGLNLTPQSQEVICVEINPFSSQCFDLSRLKLPPELQNKISIKISTSEDATHMIPGKGVIVVDPPRKGLDAKVLETICLAEKGTQLIYLSCGPHSFQKDVEKMLAHGWQIEKAEAYLFFPGSNHVEILCSLRKESG